MIFNRSKLPRPTRIPSGSRKAFTLLEIMVAMGLLALVVLSIYSSWESILKGSKVALDAAAAAQRTRIASHTLHDALLCACMFKSPGTNNYYTFLSDTQNDNSFISFTARLPDSFPRSGKFGGFPTRRLEFGVETDKNNVKILVLRQRPIVMDFDKDETEFPLVLARDVTKFLVEYVDPKTGDYVPDWDATNTLPREIRITLGLGKLDQYSTQAQQVVVDVIAIPSIAYQVNPVGGGGQNNNPGAQNNPGGVNNGNRTAPNGRGFNFGRPQ